ncbi:hypothetical protein [Paenibacillus brevis]|uniref:hypothetical protein n=1 Tax=Paenibacillus brevis TaxID=2841508 RepID=UPI003216DA68
MMKPHGFRIRVVFFVLARGEIKLSRFEIEFEEWLSKQISNELNPRRRELLRKGLGHGTVEFLRRIWYPAIGNFNDLYAEWEVRDLNN